MKRLSRSAIVLAVLWACSPADGELDLSTPLAPGQARAGVIAKDADLIGGPVAQGKVGDFKLYNARIALVVQAPGPSNGYNIYGGSIVDADVVRPVGERGESLFGEVITLFNKRALRGVSAEVVNDGRDGAAAVVRVKAVDDSFPLIESVLGQNQGPMEIEAIVDYVLEPDVDYVKVTHTLRNVADEMLPAGLNFMGFVMGNGLRAFMPGHGFAVPDAPGPGAYLAHVAPRVSYSYFSAGESLTPAIAIEAVSLAELSSYPLPPGEVAEMETYIVVGSGDVSAHAAVHRRLAAKEGLDVEPVVKVAGLVKDGSGAGVSEARVHVLGATGSYFVQTIAAADGRFSLELPPGEYSFVPTAEGRDAGEAKTVNVGEAGASGVELSLAARGWLEVSATEGADKVPAKVQVKRGVASPPLPASFGLPPAPRGNHLVDFITHEGAKFAVPPGSYSLIVSRGMEYDFQELHATVHAGESTPVEATLTRVVDTTGWLGGDYHIHGQHSPDSNDLYDLKVRSFAGEGLETPVGTEHDHLGDYEPTIARLGVGKWVRSIVGNEVSTLNIGHINAFPLARDPLEQNYGATLWFGVKGDDLMKRIRENPARPLVQLNHPRQGSSSFPVRGFFQGVQFDPPTFTRKNEYDWTLDFDAIELGNGGAPRPVNWDDWFAFLDRGLPRLGTANSDSHDSRRDNIGYPRNYVLAGTDSPRDVTIDAFMEHLRAGRLTVSGGIFIEAGIGEARLGDLVPASAVVDETVSLDVRVQAAAWVPADTLEVIVNGQVVQTLDLPSAGERPVVRLERTLDVPVPSGSDTWIVLRAGGAGDLSPVYPGATPFAFTNPIFVDGNANGRFDARRPLD